jgi:hypothetical protein
MITLMVKLERVLKLVIKIFSTETGYQSLYLAVKDMVSSVQVISLIIPNLPEQPKRIMVEMRTIRKWVNQFTKRTGNYQLFKEELSKSHHGCSTVNLLV